MIKDFSNAYENETKRKTRWFSLEKTVSICLLSGGESVLRGGVPSATFFQSLGTGSSHVSHGRLHAGRTVGRHHDMRTGRDAMVPGPRPSERYSLAHTRLSISTARSQPGARRALSETLQAVQGQQEALPGTGQGGEDIEAGFRSNVRDGRRHACRRTIIDTLAWQVSITRSYFLREINVESMEHARMQFS